ncbi:hypothetical protein [Ruegeria arenilitoris]|uniref:hypothetical protein n=1 Tax=Ruegeria arenilitoris TaxID=1173585 RepID=UPI00147C878E|nr:hypothetical protein [Ruegeria arenilitoris]
MARKTSDGRRKKTVAVYFTDTAEWDIEAYHVTKSDEDAIISNLEATPVSEEDKLKGTVRYRQVRDWEVVFQIGSSEVEVMVDICGIRPPLEEPKTQKIQRALEKVATVRGTLGI